MRVSEILQKLSHLAVESRNNISQDTVELILFVKDLAQWEAILSEILGPAVKSSGEQVSKAYSDLTKDYGGLMKDQTLYYKTFDSNSIITMIWPWMDQNQVTIKIAAINEKG